jgi:hypothetical protein
MQNEKFTLLFKQYFVVGFVAMLSLGMRKFLKHITIAIL